MIYNFVKFENTKQRLENRITITTHSSFGFPTKFFKDQKIEDFKYVTIYYDDDQKAIGFNFHNNEEEKHKFTILKSKKGYGGNVIATSFFKTYNLNSKEYHGRYVWSKNTQEGVGDLYVIEIRKLEE